MLSRFLYFGLPRELRHEDKFCIRTSLIYVAISVLVLIIPGLVKGSSILQKLEYHQA